MDNEKIKELAQRIAKDSVSSRGFSHDTLLELRAEAESNAISVIKYILETHCIVEKDKIRTAHECEVVNWYEEQNPHLRDEFLHGRRLLESLFGKEFFNTTER